MDLIQRINEHFAESAKIKTEAVKTLAEPLEQAAERMVQCLMNEGKILACGNGGSAADAQHFAPSCSTASRWSGPASPRSR